MAQEYQLPLGLHALACRAGKPPVWKFRARCWFAKLLPFRSGRAWLKWCCQAASRCLIGPLMMHRLASVRISESVPCYGRFSSLLVEERMVSNGDRKEEDANLPCE